MTVQTEHHTGEQTVADFLSQLAAGTPAPGGGAASAVAGAMAAALAAMVANLALGREKYAGVQEEMQVLAQQAGHTCTASLAAADADQAAFALVMQAYAMPKGTQAEKNERSIAIQAGLQAATQVPLETMRHALAAGRAAVAVAARGNANARTAAVCAYLLARAAFQGALWNAAVNLGSIKNTAFRSQCLESISQLQQAQSGIDAAMTAAGFDPLQAYLPNR